MVLYNVHKEAVVETYRSHICSVATLFTVIITLITYIIPLYLAHQSLGFWLLESTYREQAEVRFKHDFVLLLHDKDGNRVGYSTFDNFNEIILQKSIRLSVVKSHEADVNLDGRYDYLAFEMEIPLLATTLMRSVELILFFDYKLHMFSSIQMETMAFIKCISPFDSSSFEIDGSLKFHQKYPLPHKGSISKYNVSIIDRSTSNANELNLQHIFRNYQQRNISTNFVSNYPVWNHGPVQNNAFTVKVRMYYPEETIVYRPGFWQLIKFAWVQYLAVLLIFTYVMGRVKKFVFTNQLVISTLTKKFHSD